MKLIDFLASHNPFTVSDDLVNIATGVVAHVVNVENALQIGERIHAKKVTASG